MILLVDDDPYQSEIASYIAYELGCEFESAASGTEALQKVAQRAPDVILLDVRMPDLSGYEVCRRIKTNPETSGIQILFVTARNEEEDLLLGFEALANDYVPKPFSARELKARVRNALRTKELLDALTLRTRFLELQHEIASRLDEPLAGGDDEAQRTLASLLDRIGPFFGADGVTLNYRRPGRPETSLVTSTGWPGGGPPTYLAALALSDDPREERAPRMPGEAREAGVDWVVCSAPLWAGEELFGTLRLHRRGTPAAPGHSAELEHLVALASGMARALRRSELVG